MPRQTPWAPSRVLRWSVFAALSLFGCGGATDSAPILGSIPDFVLIDQNSKPFGTEQLRGSVWVADFIFTSCPDMCPMLTSAMATIEREIAKDSGVKGIHFVSISVDPDNDTPAVLAEYAEKYAAAGARWAFLTGTRPEIWKLSTEGFHLPVERADRTQGGPIFHSNRFVLTDRRGRIRGYYDGLDSDARDALIADLKRVAGESTDAGAP